MKKKQIHDYLNNGLHGNKKFQSFKDKNYLGSFHERCYLALTKEQIYQGKYEKETAAFLKTNHDISMRINGSISLHFTKPYITLAKVHGKPFTLIQSELNKDSYGLVLVASKAIPQEPQLFHL